MDHFREPKAFDPAWSIHKVWLTWRRIAVFSWRNGIKFEVIEDKFFLNSFQRVASCP
jgi:hypothetical protein